MEARLLVPGRPAWVLAVGRAMAEGVGLGGGDAARMKRPRTPQAGSSADYQGPEWGPFRCDRCEYASLNAWRCKRPEVVKELGDAGGGTAKVEPGGCCNYFHRDDKRTTLTHHGTLVVGHERS